MHNQDKEEVHQGKVAHKDSSQDQDKMSLLDYSNRGWPKIKEDHHQDILITEDHLQVIQIIEDHLKELQEQEVNQVAEVHHQATQEVEALHQAIQEVEVHHQVLHQEGIQTTYLVIQIHLQENDE